MLTWASNNSWKLGLWAAVLVLLAPSLALAQTWHEAGFPSRAGHCAVFDPVGNRMLIFGGKEGGTLRGDVWVLRFTGFGPRWTFGGAGGPTPRAGHSGIYDPVRQRMIVFGGNDGALSNQVWAGSTLLAPLGTPPSPREGHVAVYDPVGDRMIVFGGTDGAVLDDVWSLSLADPPTWTLLSPSGTPPSARKGACAAYDSQRQRMLVFGGASASTALNDTWALDLASATWSQLATGGSAPEPRVHASALYDPTADRLLIVGGEDFGGLFPVLGAAQLSLSGTPTWQTGFFANGSRGSLVYDSAHGTGLFYGGLYDAVGTTNQTWTVNLTAVPSLTRLFPTAAAPSGLQDESAVFAGPGVIAFGGLFTGGFEPQVSNNTFALDVPIWFGPNPPPDLHYDWVAIGSGTPPAARYGHSAIVDNAHGMLIFGGNTIYGSPALQNDVWALPTGASGPWSQLLPTGSLPPRRYEHTAIYDGPRHRMIVFGGDVAEPFNLPVAVNDLWQLDLGVNPPAWSQIIPFGTPPAARFGHSAIHDLDNHRMIVFGGSDASGALFNDVWSLSLDDPPTWTQMFPTGTPPSPRQEHSAIYQGWTTSTRRMLVYGGTTGREVWSLSLAGAPAWTQLTVAGAPPDVWSRHLAVGLDGGAAGIIGRPVMLILGGPSASVYEFNQEPTVAVDNPPMIAGFALDGAVPNPAQGFLDIAYTLPDGAPARLEVFDLGGRKVASRDVGAVGLGRHVVRIAENHELAPGLYLVKLTRNAESRMAKVAVLR